MFHKRKNRLSSGTRAVSQHLPPRASASVLEAMTPSPEPDSASSMHAPPTVHLCPRMGTSHGTGSTSQNPCRYWLGTLVPVFYPVGTPRVPSLNHWSSVVLLTKEDQLSTLNSPSTDQN